MKASARAYAIQGLVKYHGLKNQKLRLPFHDSISVCMKSLPTITTVEFNPDLGKDQIRINGKSPSQNELSRVVKVLDALRNISGGHRSKARIESRNPEVNGKGLGFSASGFAALGLAAAKALDLTIDTQELSEIVRLGAGSASRSLVGGFSIWYASKNGRSYAKQLAPANSIKLATVIVPIGSEIKTEKAHADAVRSPFYKSRLNYLRTLLPRMKRAISSRDVKSIGRLAEEDTLNLHAVTMTGRDGIVLLSPLSIEIINEVRRLRHENGIPAWFSLDTGPSVFVNTTSDAAPLVRRSLSKIASNTILSGPGGPANIIDKHLF